MSHLPAPLFLSIHVSHDCSGAKAESDDQSAAFVFGVHAVMSPPCPDQISAQVRKQGAGAAAVILALD